VTSPSFCTRFNERVYITAIGWEFCFGTMGDCGRGGRGPIAERRVRARLVSITIWTSFNALKISPSKHSSGDLPVKPSE